MKRILPTIFVGAVACMLPGAGIAQTSPRASVPVSIDPQAVTRLVTRLRTAIAGVPRDAARADYEAALIFAIDQSGQPLDVVLAALGQIDASQLTPAARSALAAVSATRVRVAQRGTGSIAGGPTIGLAFGSALSVTGGSNTGSSDYTR